MKRFLVASMAGAVVFAVAFGAAAALNVDGGVVQAGSDETLTCDSDGVRVDGWGLETDDGKVYSVRFADISSDCIGADLFVNVWKGSSRLAQGGPVLIGGSTATVSLSTPVPAVDILRLEVFIEGA